jgi:ABC-type Fe3+/spermidine/putrescine transport system ATPase subunit
VGTPLEVYQLPRKAFVADFVGVMNFLHGVVASATHVQMGSVTIPVANLEETTPGASVQIAIRPEDIEVMAQPKPRQGIMRARLQQAEFLGPFYRLHLDLHPTQHGEPTGATTNGVSRLLADLPVELVRRIDTSAGAELFIRLPEELVQVFPIHANGQLRR